MMPLFLTERDTVSRERMDDPNCDRTELINTYRQFSTINSMISGWKSIYRTHIKPVLNDKNRHYSLLDIGFGGGDIPIKLAKWAQQDSINLRITAIETDPRALEFIRTIETSQHVDFKHASSSDLLEQKKKFDIVISNHLLHHLKGAEFEKLLREAKQLSTRTVLFNDIARSDIGYALFNIFSRPIFRSSFITEDGLTSIKRSYTLQELHEKTPDDWTVQRLFPFRLLLKYLHSSS